jgi:hypothetical protein
VRLRRAFIAGTAVAGGLLLAGTLAASASTNVSVSRDNCGGLNGHVVWAGGSSPFIQLCGEVWDNNCPQSKVRRLLRRLSGRRFHAGDTLVISLEAPGYLPERARVRIRNGKLPEVTPLPA